jgi:thiamine-phosphate pyrophosphorylase
MMGEGCLLYYITDRSAFAGNDRARRRRLIDKIAEAAAYGIDYIQLREKDLSARELEALARNAVRAIREQGKRTVGHESPVTALLINSRTDVALAASAGGVHLRAEDISPQDVRRAWRESADRGRQELRPEPLIGISCHSQEEVVRAATSGANFAVFAPVFEKKDARESVPAGLDGLRRACAEKIPVLALGGINLQNAGSCLRAGAAGIAGIRLFQENEISEVVRALRR